MLDEPHPGIRRLLAPNPSPMTGPGTNGYIVGTGRVAVVDPGPDDDRHLAAWLDVLASEEVAYILVTHAHLDHSALAPRLADAVGSPVLAFGPPEAGRSPTMTRLAALGSVDGGEGVDRSFVPDVRIADGDLLRGPDWQIEVLHTPGHFSGHLSFRVGDAVLTGDHVLAWTSTLVSPPDGDLGQFLETCERLRGLGASVFLPGHGAPLTDPRGRLDWLVAHRLERAGQIVEALRAGHSDIPGIVRELYRETPSALWPAAARNVLAHLVALVEEGRAVADPGLDPRARYRLA